MKNKYKLLVFLLLIFLIGSCNSEKVKEPNRIKIGVVETTDLSNKSTLHWYDENLELIDKQILKYASLGGTFSRPIYDEDEVFIIPQGLVERLDEEKVISINTNDFSIKEFNVPNIALNNLAVSKKYIFVNSNLNNSTHISRIDRDTDEFIEKVYENASFNTIISSDNFLFLLGNMKSDDEKSFIYVLDEDFHILETIDVTEYGIGGFKFLKEDNNLLLSFPYKITNEPNNQILKLDADSYQLDAINLKENHPDSIIKYKDKLLISHNDIVTGQGSLLTVMNMEEETSQIYDLKTDLDYVEVYKDSFFVVDQEKISQFSIDNDFELLKEVIINKNKDSYISMMIIID